MRIRQYTNGIFIHFTYTYTHLCHCCCTCSQECVYALIERQVKKKKTHGVHLYCY